MGRGSRIDTNTSVDDTDRHENGVLWFGLSRLLDFTTISGSQQGVWRFPSKIEH